MKRLINKRASKSSSNDAQDDEYIHTVTSPTKLAQTGTETVELDRASLQIGMYIIASIIQKGFVRYNIYTRHV